MADSCAAEENLLGLMPSMPGFVPLPAIDGGWNFEVQSITDPYQIWVEHLVEVGHSKFLDTDQELVRLASALSHGFLTYPISLAQTVPAA